MAERAPRPPCLAPQAASRDEPDECARSCDGDPPPPLARDTFDAGPGRRYCRCRLVHPRAITCVGDSIQEAACRGRSSRRLTARAAYRRRELLPRDSRHCRVGNGRVLRARHWSGWVSACRGFRQPRAYGVEPGISHDWRRYARRHGWRPAVLLRAQLGRDASSPRPARHAARGAYRPADTDAPHADRSAQARSPTLGRAHRGD